MTFAASDVSIVVPTYNRGAILADTLRRFLALEPRPAELLVIDQTASHLPEIATQLDAWAVAGDIRWIRLPKPSIPHAMNEGLRLATRPIVLFLDDDVAPVPEIVARHAAAYDDANTVAVIGQCLQPGESPQHWRRGEATRDIPDLDFRFNHDAPEFISNVIAMNLSVVRDRALAIGGFDENFVFVAYRFETDFALRLIAAGGRIRFEPSARVDHLRLSTGGTRAYGDHRTSPSPAHSAGDYYFALHHSHHFTSYVLHRLRTNVLTRFHVKHPWTIPAKLIGEARGLILARQLRREGRRLLAGNLNRPSTIPRHELP
jgi:GT2 family glycosyltransferase